MSVHGGAGHGPAASGGGRGHGRGRGGRFTSKDLLVLLVFGCRVIQTVMRMAMGALVVYICEDYACTEASKGWLLSAHAFGYSTTQILGGILADHLGGKAVIAMACALAGLSLASTPAASAMSGLSGVAAAQVVMGVAMGPLFPASVQLLAKWLSPEERAFASTALDTGITLGSLITLPLSGALAIRSGWRCALLVYGLAALGFAALWSLFAVETPPEAERWLPEPDVALDGFAEGGACEAPRRGALEPPPPKGGAAVDGGAAQALGGIIEVLRHRRLWAIYWAHFAFNFGVYFVNNWSAIYYLEVFRLRPEEASLHLSLPHVANMAVKVFVCPYLDRRLQRDGFSSLARRRIFTGVGFAAPALLFRLIPSFTGPWAATTCLSLAFGFFALHPSGFKANYMDVTTSRGGLVSGVGNTVASVASSAGPLTVAYLRETSGGSWHSSFAAVSLLCAAAAAIFASLSSATPIEVATPKAGKKHMMWANR